MKLPAQCTLVQAAQWNTLSGELYGLCGYYSARMLNDTLHAGVLTVVHVHGGSGRCLCGYMPAVVLVLALPMKLPGQSTVGATCAVDATV